MKADLKLVGLSGGIRRYRIAVSSTRFYVGEPIHTDATYTAGVISANTWVVAANDTPVVGTYMLAGIASKDAEVNQSGIVPAQQAQVEIPIPEVTIIRGRAETVANIDTDAELLAILGDATLIDYNSTGSTTGGPLYTIKDTASADVNGLTIVDGDIVKGTLDTVLHFRAIRDDVTT